MARKNSTMDYWLHHYNSFKTKGITQREYCRQEGIGYYSFNTWKRRFDKSESETSLQELSIKFSPSKAERIELRLENNITITVPDNFSKETLLKLITALRDAE